MGTPVKKPAATRQPKPPRQSAWAKVFGFPQDPRSYGRYLKEPSPDTKFILVFEPGDECAMMRYLHQFRLVDSSKKVAQAFLGLFSPIQRAWWSPNSRIVAVAADEQSGGLILYDVVHQRYALVHFNAYQETVRVTSTGVRIGVDPKEFESVFGTEFQRPRDLSFRFSALRWFPAPEAGDWDLREAFRSAPKGKWDPPPSKAMRAYAKRHGIQLLNTRP